MTWDLKIRATDPPWQLQRQLVQHLVQKSVKSYTGLRLYSKTSGKNEGRKESDKATHQTLATTQLI